MNCTEQVDLSDLFGKGYLKLENLSTFFNQVRVNPKMDTLAWGDDIDLDPYVLREKISKIKYSDLNYKFH